MGDPRRPWQDDGHDNDPDETPPRHFAPPGGHLAWRGRRPQRGDARPPGDLDDSYDDACDEHDDSYDDLGGAGYDDPGVPWRWSPRALFADLAWRYRSAPLWARVTADVTAASLVLVLIVGVSLALRQDGAPPPAAADRPAITAAVATTTTTRPATAGTTGTPKDPPATTTTTTTITTAPPTTTATTAPPTTTTMVRSTTTTAPTTTTEAVSFRNCTEARAAGALPLREGDPGYGRHLDRDGDGLACEWDDRWR